MPTARIETLLNLAIRIVVKRKQRPAYASPRDVWWATCNQAALEKNAAGLLQ
jgi:hypothetical protein